MRLSIKTKKTEISNDKNKFELLTVVQIRRIFKKLLQHSVEDNLYKEISDIKIVKRFILHEIFFNLGPQKKSFPSTSIFTTPLKIGLGIKTTLMNSPPGN